VDTSEQLRCTACGKETKEQERVAAASSVTPAGIVREFRMTDYEAVLALWKATEGIVLVEADNRPNITKYIRRNPGMSFVWEVSGTIVGAILAGSDGRRGFLHHLAVAPTHRQRGIGRALVERVLVVMAKSGIEKCHLMVEPSNVEGRGFWKSLGWMERPDVVLMSRVILE
jgi:ribosomal protein S18 acetylase RimI-like enzyme